MSAPRRLLWFVHGSLFTIIAAWAAIAACVITGKTVSLCWGSGCQIVVTRTELLNALKKTEDSNRALLLKLHGGDCT